MEAVLASRLLPLGVSVQFAADYHPQIGGYSSGANVAVAPDANLSGALDAIRAAMTPAAQETIIEWLAELSVRTRRREHDDFSDGLLVEVYSRELGKYPADVVKRALFCGWTFWPALDGELVPLCERIVRGRRQALQRAAAGYQPPPEPNRRVSREAAAAIMASVKRIPTE